MPRLDELPVGHDTFAIPGGSFEHAAKVDLCETPVVHSLEEMWAELQLPVPPLRPCATTQSRSPSRLRTLFGLSSAPLAERLVSAIDGFIRRLARSGFADDCPDVNLGSPYAMRGCELSRK